MGNQIYSGASETSAAAAITAAMAQLVVRLEAGESLQVVPLDVKREPTHWVATLRVITLQAAPDGRAHRKEEQVKMPIAASRKATGQGKAAKEAVAAAVVPSAPVVPPAIEAEAPAVEVDFDEAADPAILPPVPDVPPVAPESGPAPEA